MSAARGVLALALLLAGRAAVAAPARFDLGAARDASTLGAVVDEGSRRTLDGCEVVRVTFTSTQWDARGRARSIRLSAWLARPPGADATRRPALLTLHGLGGRGEAQQAANLARNLDVVALELSAPGLGDSEGRGPSFENAAIIFDGVPDVRGSWIYAYAYACMRALTYLAQRADVDPRALVVTGTSMGGVAALVANGVDDRIHALLAVASSGGIRAAARAGSWFARLLAGSGRLTIDSPGPRATLRALDPLLFAPTQKGKVVLLAGAQDEFFPIDQVLATYRALRAPLVRVALFPDFDHLWYFHGGCPAACMPGSSAPQSLTAVRCPGSPPCPAACPKDARPPYCGPAGSYDRREDWNARWSLLLRALVADAASPKRPFSLPPAAPRVRASPTGVTVWPAPGEPPVAVRLALSDNGGYTYAQIALERGPDGAYRIERAIPRGAIVFAEVELDSGAVSTSAPELPRNFRPIIRPFAPKP